ncbi:SpoIIE family protein phosphatase [Crocinitomix catalasitica]|uniref:SpoIIE family protein phosphatase n=1 Tax=Crocinitomix catalasitica TaxID=184607 RepID=UPI00048676E0|nr:SpoIIE family protein phosphatase [Crocinitomix catalasitica]
MLKKLTIKGKILLSMLSLVVLGFILIFAFIVYEKKKDSIDVLSTQLNTISNYFHDALQFKSDFLLYERINPEFFISGRSHYIDSSKKAINNFSQKLHNFSIHRKYLTHENDEILVKKLKSYISKFQVEMDSLVILTLNRGFEDYGIEGKMRWFAHQMETEYKEIVEPADILTLRRHEKDFILRKELKYKTKFEQQYQRIFNKINTNSTINTNKETHSLTTLKMYLTYFDSLVKLEGAIRLKNGGLLTKIDKTGKVIQKSLQQIQTLATAEQNMLLVNLRSQFVLGITLYFIFIIAVSFKLSSTLTKGIKKLSQNVKSFVESNYKITANYNDFKGQDEIAQLAKNLKLLEDEIVIHFSNYKTKVKERAKKILTQKAAIESKQSEIKQKNKDILASIRYARKIQDTILPKPIALDELLPKHFILYKPKDIVSGDFYWVKQAQQKVFIAVCDCTGHGVPGAFMSIIGNNFLNHAVNVKKMVEPNEILQFLDTEMSNALSQSDNNQHNYPTKIRLNDGMDIALISIDYKTKELNFSGAQRPLIMIRNNQITEIKGDRSPIGGHITSAKNNFHLHRFNIEKDDQFYLFTDGYADQFGGPNNKKFKHRYTKQLLHSNHQKTIKEQGIIIQETHELWKGQNEQVDDICMIGLQF